MQPHGLLLAEKCSVRLSQPDPLPDSYVSVEQALFRARIAIDAGWQLTPDEVMTLVGADAWRGDGLSATSQEFAPELEDEIDDIARFFGE